MQQKKNVTKEFRRGHLMWCGDYVSNSIKSVCLLYCKWYGLRDLAVLLCICKCFWTWLPKIARDTWLDNMVWLNWLFMRFKTPCSKILKAYLVRWKNDENPCYKRICFRFVRTQALKIEKLQSLKFLALTLF